MMGSYRVLAILLITHIKWNAIITLAMETQIAILSSFAPFIISFFYNCYHCISSDEGLARYASEPETYVFIHLSIFYYFLLTRRSFLLF